MKIPQNGRVGIVGAGVSGLTYAYFLSKLRPDLAISIYDKASAPGGWIQSPVFSINGNPTIFEKGPRTLRGVSDGTLLIVDILRQLGSGHEVEVMKSSSVANRKWILGPTGELVQVPNSAGSLFRFLASDVTQGLIPSIMGEPFRKPLIDAGDESISSFMSRRFGSSAIANNILSAVMHGIYSGDVDRLSANATLGKMKQMEQEHGLILRAMFKNRKQPAPRLPTCLEEYERISPNADLPGLAAQLKKYPILRLANGLQTFPKVLNDALVSKGLAKIHYGSEILACSLPNTTLNVDGEDVKFDHLRFTSLSAMNIPGLESIKDELGAVEHSSIFLANVYCPTPGLLIPKGKNGFGFLVPKRNRNPESLLGVIFDSDTEKDSLQLFGSAAETTRGDTLQGDKVTFMMGGHYFSSRGVPSNKASIRALKKCLADFLGVDTSKYNFIIRNEDETPDKEVLMSENDILISFNLHERCIPQYNVGFLDRAGRMSDTATKLSNGSVSLGGTGLGKLGVPDCVLNSLEDALKIA